MGLQNYLNQLLKTDINYLEIFIYLITSILIFCTILYSIYYYGTNFYKGEETILNLKIILSNSISLALSLILTIEILKIYYIKTYKQLVIVSILVMLKLIINYFLNIEVNAAHDILRE